MHINTVHASAFGPFRGRTLELAPGLNVVHGPNEAGKSSWFAATYAGLAGRRRARGRGTTAQADFAKRHKPWSGSQWGAGVTVTLDSGLVLALEHDLRRGESRIVDAASRRPIPLADLERQLGIGLTTEATLDGTRLLRLNRDSARATVFTGQADILRVLADAGELQELLERAATTAGADATADGALTWLAARRSEWVGSAAVGAKPLRARRMAVERARNAASERRDSLVRLVEAIVERQRIEVPLQRAREDLELAERLLRWQEVYELRGRVDQAVELSTKLAASAGADRTVDEEQVRAATAILGAFETGSDVPPLPPGACAADLQAEIDTLPERPDGDLEPRPEVEAAHRELSRAHTALTTHLGNAPADGPELARTRLSSDELRALADVVDAPPPVVDPSLSAQLAALQQEAEEAERAYAVAQAAYEAATRRNDEKLRAHAEAVEEHARVLAEFERVQAERTALYESLRQEAEEAERAYAVAQAAYEAATRRNDEKLRAHAEAVEKHAQASAEFQQVQAERTARTEAARNRSTYFLLAGAAILVVGVGTAIAGPVVVGILAAILGGALAVGGFLVGRAPSGPRPTDETNPPQTAPAPPVPPRFEQVQAPSAPVPDKRLVELQVELGAQQPALPVPPRLEEVQAPSAPVPDKRLVELQVELGAQQLAAPVAPGLEEMQTPLPPVPDPRLMELQIELKAQAPAPPVPPRFEEVQAPSAPAPDKRLMDLQAEIKARENAVRRHEERVASARARVLAESLEPDPATLRRLARSIEDADAAQERRKVHTDQAIALRSTRDDATHTLARTLGRKVESKVTEDMVVEEFRAFEAYVATCRERAATAKLASRRPDLVAAQSQRRQLELAHATAVAERDGQRRAVRDLASALGLGATSSAEDAAEQLREWRRAQEERRTEQAEMRELAARLDQLLDGRELADWQAELARLMEISGPEPDVMPGDVEQFRAEAGRRHEAVVGRAGQLEGQQQQLSKALESVAEAVEQEAEAARALLQVETLASCMDTAIAELNLARDRAHASIAPALEARMRPWLPRITNGRYLDVAVEPSNLTMKVTQADGAVRNAELLSHGTTEQLFLLLRVILSQVLSGGMETVPLILDDVTTQSDRARKVAIMDLLHEISTDHQVVLFTQEQEVIGWAEANLDSDRDKLVALPGPASTSR